MDLVNKGLIVLKKWLETELTLVGPNNWSRIKESYVCVQNNRKKIFAWKLFFRPVGNNINYVGILEVQK